MKKTFYILQDNNNFSYVTELKDEQRDKLGLISTI